MRKASIQLLTISAVILLLVSALITLQTYVEVAKALSFQ